MEEISQTSIEFPDTTYLPKFYLETLGEDQGYYAEVMERKPTVFFRPYDRTASNHPNYWPSDKEGLSYIGFILEYGSLERRQLPTYMDHRVSARILDRDAKKISEITPEEFASTYEEITDSKALCGWLGNKYPNTQFSDDSIVTVYRVTYQKLDERNTDSQTSTETD